MNDRILERIDKGTIDVTNHPGIKTGTETYSNMTFEPKKDTTELKSTDKPKKKGCCG